MPSEKFLDIRPSQGLDSGLMPSAEIATGLIWRTGLNVWFRELTLEHSPGKELLVALIGRKSKTMAQVFTLAGNERLYYEDLGIVNFWENGVSTVIGSLDVNGSYDMESWGDWLLATDDVNPIKIWKNTGTLATIADAATQFSTARIIKRMAQHVLAYNTNILPTGFHWSSANDPETWTPTLTNSARNLPIRNLDSNIIAVEPLGATHAVYSQNTLLLVRFIGGTQFFGTPTQSLQGIGAVGKKSVVPLGNANVGISRAGVFMTDGNSFSYVDRPYIDKFLQSNIDWSKGEEIVGYWDERLSAAVWSLPLLLGDKISLTFDPKLLGGSQRPFSFIEGDFSFGMKRDVFEFPLVSLADGIYYRSIPDTIAGTMTLASHLFDAGEPRMYKSWDLAILTGTIGNESRIRFGFTDEPQLASIEWDEWITISEAKIPFGPRESVYLAFELITTQPFKCNAISVFGEKAGNVN